MGTSLQTENSFRSQIKPLGNDQPRLHLRFLDGLRGLAALYVLLFHAQMMTVQMENYRWVSPVVVCGTRWLEYGHYAVAMFIVLSGYCLMLPVARSGGNLVGGFRQYLIRRARRMLPPYYAALVLSLIINFVYKVVSIHFGASSHKQEGSILTDALTHLFLVHNLSRNYSHSINSAMWSVATEWDIYFLFPILLLPIWRKFGSVAVISIGLLAGLLPIAILPSSDNFAWACPWYISLFAMGMVGAAVMSRNSASTQDQRLPFYWLSGAFAICCVLLAPRRAIDHDGGSALTDILAGLAAICVIAGSAQIVQNNFIPRSVVLRILESRPAVQLGVFSYSIYLIHLPILVCLYWGLRSLKIPYDAVCVVVWLAGVPLILAGAYLFHLLFERRFMSSAGLPQEVRSANSR